jgi:uncharacterized LabA/DUF88 family protein
MPDKIALVLDGGFLTKKLQRSLGHYPTVQDVNKVCREILAQPDIASFSLLRIYFYDSPPLLRVVKNPIDGYGLDLASSQIAKDATSLQEGLEMLPDFAVRRGTLVHHGWKLGKTSMLAIQKAPRAPTAKDFVPDIQQKGVDLKIGLDIAWMSLKGIVQHIVVVAGDADLVPAFKLARKEGVRIYLDCLGHGVSRDLRVHIDKLL